MILIHVYNELGLYIKSMLPTMCVGIQIKESTKNIDKNSLLLVSSSFHHVKHGEEAPSRGRIEPTCK